MLACSTLIPCHPNDDKLVYYGLRRSPVMRSRTGLSLLLVANLQNLSLIQASVGSTQVMISEPCSQSDSRLGLSSYIPRSSE